MENQDGFEWLNYRFKNYDYLQLRVFTRVYFANCNRMPNT